MDLTLTEDQELVAATARELLAARAGAAGARAMRGDPSGFAPGLWKEMAGLGWTGLPFPEEDGGAGGDFVDLCLVLEQVGYAQVPVPLLPSAACAGMVLARFGDAAQRSAWLAPIAAGRVVGCAPLPWDRPGEGPVATPDAGGGAVLDGTAALVPFAGSAEGFAVVARLDGEPRLFLVEAGSAGLSTRPVDTVGHDRPHHVDLAGLRVPAGGLVGGGRAAAEAMSAFGAAATCAEMAGGAQRVLDDTVAYASERRQFGRPIGTFQAVQHHCADMAVDVLGTRFTAFEAVWRLSAHGPGDAEALRAVSAAKAWVGEAYERVCGLGHQVHGAIGFTAEHDLHLFTRHAMASALAFGDSAHHLDRLADDLSVP